VRSDEAIRREIEEDLLRGTLWIDHPDDVHVEVTGGEVTLAGKLDSPADIEVVPLHVRQVPGVVGVTSTLTLRNEGSPAKRPGRACRLLPGAAQPRSARVRGIGAPVAP
jgi:hypothetical protein